MTEKMKILLNAYSWRTLVVVHCGDVGNSRLMGSDGNVDGSAKKRGDNEVTTITLGRIMVPRKLRIRGFSIEYS